jgi:hypothetical protein
MNALRIILTFIGRVLSSVSYAITFAFIGLFIGLAWPWLDESRNYNGEE